MAWWSPEEFEKKRAFLETRMNVVRTVRRFFEYQDFYEVETPILQASPCAEAHLHGFETTLLGHDLKAKAEMYLHTSPEFAMKKLLVAGVAKMFQICHVFRNAEGGSMHSPEFTMIEWYRAHDSYAYLMEDCVRLLRYLAEKMDFQEFVFQDRRCNPHGDWNNLTVFEAFDRYASIDLEAVLDDTKGFAQVASRNGVRIADGDGWEDIFHAVMAEKIEPQLGVGTPTILYEYPVCLAALSRKKPGDERLAERFELYVCGVELANAFGELTDAKEQSKRYKAEMKLKKELYGTDYPVDTDFIKALEYGMPESAGIALGMDRLAMLVADTDDINNVLWAPV